MSERSDPRFEFAEWLHAEFGVDTWLRTPLHGDDPLHERVALARKVLEALPGPGVGA